jgi:NodT family efflux transporter outer membrane factor (OMF) lipoprotein
VKTRWRVVCTAGLSGLLLSAGCKVGPDYRRPEVPTPPEYKEASPGGIGWKVASPADDVDRGAWWSIYRDPLLDELVRQVEFGNQNLKAAEAAYRQAVALANAARAALMPQLSASPEALRGSSGATSTTRTSGLTSTSRSLQVTATWDLDLWGKVRRQVESDRAAAQASQAQLAAARLSAQAELVSDYFQLRYEDSLQTLLTDTVAAYGRTLAITRNQYEAGVAARSDVVVAETQLQTTQAQLIAVGVSRAQLEHAIALLMGKTPGELTLPAVPLAATVPPIPLVVPSVLLERRPDVAQAERTVAQQSALIGVAVAAYYPDVSLSGMFGYAATAAGGLITASNRVWSGAVTGNQLIFDGGARSATVMAAWAAYDESVANYRQAVLSAFEEVESSLSSLRVLAQEAEAQEHAVALSRQGVEIALHEYEAGLQSYTAVATAQATELANEEVELQVLSNRLIQSVALLKAVGGGWTSRDGAP